MDAAPRPHVHANCAVSADGRLAYAGGRRALLSGPEDLARVQRLRAASDAIVVGAGTVLADDPSLRVHWELLGQPPGREPARIVLAGRRALPPTAKIFDGRSPTIVAAPASAAGPWPAPADRLVVGVDRVDVPELCTALYRRGFREVLVEGGAGVLAAFVRAGVVDALTVYLAPVLIGGSSAPTLLAGPETVGPDGVWPLNLESVERLGPGVLIRWIPAATAVTR